MKNIAKFPVAVLCFGILLSLSNAPSSFADNVPQTVSRVTVDVQKLSTGFRASKVIGAGVVNENNESIGKLDDLIVSPDDNRSAFAILSVGGALGMGNHLVAVPFSTLAITKDKVVLSGVTKDQLKAMPEFKYSSQ